MVETIVLAMFAVSLLLCIVFSLPILAALIFGALLFGGYALHRGHSLRGVLSMAWAGIKTAKNVLLIFILIGMITAMWRISGTIPFIVYHAARFFAPKTMLLSTFLLCALLSFLTGTSFGTAATMGVICAAIATGMGLPLTLIGGAVLAGSFFGDRGSPMSTSALLVSELTGTNIFDNVKAMMKTAAVPFILSCIIYLALGAGVTATPPEADVCAVFARYFALNPWLLLPAVVIVVLSILRVRVMITMSLSIACAAVLAFILQDAAAGEIVRAMALGFAPADDSLAALLGGGGIWSMRNVFCIVCLSSTYAGIFKGTGLLEQLKHHLASLAAKATPFGCIFLTSIVTSMIACNQTLAIMLTYQLCDEVEDDRTKMAISIENTAVVIAALIPWSIACAVPLAAVNAPSGGVLAACYLYLIPLWNLALALYRKKRE